MKVIITGAAGFIGSHLCQMLLDRGDEVVGLDNMCSTVYSAGLKAYNIEQVRATDVFNSFRFYNFDIGFDHSFNKKEIIKEFKGADAVCHMAAHAGVRNSLSRPAEYQRVNVEGTARVLDAARIWGVKRFVFASSSSVYGLAGCVTDQREDDYPISPYAASKRAGELLGHSFASVYDVDFRALRLFTVYGPRIRPDLAIGKFIRRIMDGDEITLYGDGDTGRDYTYIDDCVNGIMEAIHRNSYEMSRRKHLGRDTLFQTLDLGAGTPTKLKTLIECIEDAVGKKANVKYISEQPGDAQITMANPAIAKEWLGFKSDTKITEGIPHVVDWMKKNKELQRLYI